MLTPSDHPAPLRGPGRVPGVLWGQGGARAAVGKGEGRDAETSGSARKEICSHHHSQFGAHSHFKQGTVVHPGQCQLGQDWAMSTAQLQDNPQAPVMVLLSALKPKHIHLSALTFCLVLLAVLRLPALGRKQKGILSCYDCKTRHVRKTPRSASNELQAARLSSPRSQQAARGCLMLLLLARTVLLGDTPQPWQELPKPRRRPRGGMVADSSRARQLDGEGERHLLVFERPTLPP